MSAAIGHDAIAKKGWFATHKWLIARRFSQLGFFLLFLAGPWFGVWWVSGNLASSRFLDSLWLSDPFVLLQSLFAGHAAETTAIVGALIVLVFYAIVGGRVYCSWVCPVNVVTDLASYLRRKWGIKTHYKLPAGARFGLLIATLIASAVTGTAAWETINPVTAIQRGIIFGLSLSTGLLAALFLFDLLISRRGWCGHLCPMGAFYSLLGKVSLIRVTASKRADCNDCADCYAVCPEPDVIKPALKGEAKGIGPVITDSQCTNCGRCIDICSEKVFTFTGHRFAGNKEANP